VLPVFACGRELVLESRPLPRMPADQIGWLDDDQVLRQSNKQESLENMNRSAAVVGAAFFSRSRNKAGWVPKNGTCRLI